MTPAEIRRHALAIAAIRKFENRSAGQRKRFERGYDTGQDFRQSQALRANRNLAYADVGAVDRVFEARELSGRLPRGCWS